MENTAQSFPRPWPPFALPKPSGGFGVWCRLLPTLEAPERRARSLQLAHYNSGRRGHETRIERNRDSTSRTWRCVLYPHHLALKMKPHFLRPAQIFHNELQLVSDTRLKV